MGRRFNYNIVKAATKKQLMDFGMDEATAHHLARGRRIFKKYGENKPIIEIDWDDLYAMWENYFPRMMPFKYWTPEQKESHKKDFYLQLKYMKERLESYYESVLDGKDPSMYGYELMKEKLNRIRNWNRPQRENQFLNWNRDNPMEVKE